MKNRKSKCEFLFICLENKFSQRDATYVNFMDHEGFHHESVKPPHITIVTVLLKQVRQMKPLLHINQHSSTRLHPPQPTSVTNFESVRESFKETLENTVSVSLSLALSLSRDRMIALKIEGGKK